MIEIKWPNQMAHMLWSASWMLGTALYRPQLGQYVFYGLIAFAFLDEIFDVLGPAKQDLVGAAVDVGFFVLGAVISTAVLGRTGKL